MIQHSDITLERWREMSILEQMANIGSEVERCLNWKLKNNLEYSQKAAARALELMDLTLDSHREFCRLREIARVRECFTDYVYGTNEWKSTDKFFRDYFWGFVLANRINR